MKVREGDHVGICCCTMLYLLRMVADGLRISSSAFPHLDNQSGLHHFQQINSPTTLPEVGAQDAAAKICLSWGRLFAGTVI